MIDIRVNSAGLRALAAGLPNRHDKAAKSAMKLTLARAVRPQLKQDLSEGVGPSKAPLTQLESRRRGTQALAWYSSLVAYSVEPTLGGYIGRAGLSNEAAAGKRSKPSPEKLIQKTVEGAVVTITKREQLNIIKKLKKRGRVAVRKPKRRSKVVRMPIRQVVPKVGARLKWPRRDFVSEFESRHGRAIGRIFGFYYDQKLQGKRI